MLLRWLFSSTFGIDTNPQNNKTPTPPSTTPGSTPIPASALPSSASQSTSTFTTQQQQPTPTTANYADPDERPPYPDLLSRRSLKQLGLMLGGAGFLYWSVMVSRRAAVRHHLAAQLRFFQGHHEYMALRGVSLKDVPHHHPSHQHPSLPPLAQRREPLLALEALGLASLNIMSFAIMATGGLCWAFDVSSLEDLKRYARRSVARSVERRAAREAEEGSEDAQAERDVAEWFGKMFGVANGSAEEGKEKNVEEKGEDKKR